MTAAAGSARPRRPPVAGGLALSWQRLVEGRPPAGFGLFVPSDPNAALEDLDEAAFGASDERMPYFATLWPAAEALARALVSGGPWPRPLAGVRVLDLGCGLGAVGLAAARRGARVTFLDWEPRCLEIVARSARALGVAVEGAIAADWRRPPSLSRFGLILGADVLYEERNVRPVARFLALHLAPGGEAWIADPGRSHARRFPEALAEQDLIQEETALEGPGPERIHLWRVLPRS